MEDLDIKMRPVAGFHWGQKIKLINRILNKNQQGLAIA